VHLRLHFSGTRRAVSPPIANMRTPPSGTIMGKAERRPGTNAFLFLHPPSEPRNVQLHPVDSESKERFPAQVTIRPNFYRSEMGWWTARFIARVVRFGSTSGERRGVSPPV